MCILVVNFNIFESVMELIYVEVCCFVLFGIMLMMVIVLFGVVYIEMCFEVLVGGYVIVCVVVEYVG